MVDGGRLRPSIGPPRQHAGCARPPVRRGLALERRFLVDQPGRIALAARDPSSGPFELVLDVLRATLGGLVHVHAPRAVRVDARRTDRQLDPVEDDRRSKLVTAVRVRPHEDALLRPLLRDHHDRAIMARRRRRAPHPVIDDPDRGHVGAPSIPNLQAKKKPPATRGVAPAGPARGGGHCILLGGVDPRDATQPLSAWAIPAMRVTISAGYAPRHGC